MSETVGGAVPHKAVAGSDVAAAQGHWTRSPAAKVGGVLGLLVAMLIPQSLTSGLIYERENRQADVLATFRNLFALLLISIAEPLGFAAAYAVSAAAVILQASLYTLSVVRRAGLAGIFAGVLGALFAFIYVVLSLDSYALLAGTVALFAILSVLMAVTRRVNWAAA